MEASGTTLIARPAGAVWDYVTDVANDASWRTGVDESGWQHGEAIGVGALGYTVAGDQKAEWRVVSLEEGERVEWELLSGPIKGRGGYHLVPVEGGTQFTLLADIEPTGWLRLLGPVFARIGRRQNQRDVEKLRDILESTPQGPDHS
jgi:hypothetical protein